MIPFRNAFVIVVSFFAGGFISSFIDRSWSDELSAVEVRIGELIRVQGMRDNQLTGYGLVVGLSGTGDTRSPLTGEALNNYLNHLGVDSKIRPKDTRNVASVMITASIPTWAKVGDRIDVTVASIGDARSLEGGVLLQSPLKAGNGEIIAVAAGPLAQSPGSDEGRKTYSKRTAPKNTALVFGGGLVEREIASSSAESSQNSDSQTNERIRIHLLNPSYSTLNIVLDKLNETFTEEELRPNVISKRELELSVPSGKGMIQFLSEMEDLKVEPEAPARVVINEKSGTIVMGGNLVLDEVAVSKQGLHVKSNNSVGKSRYFWTDNNEKKEAVFLVKKANTVKILVDELNRMGASTQDIIAILQSLKQSGALHAEVIVQ